MEGALFVSCFVMGFLGSWHCGVMCGPLSCSFRKVPHFFAYHLGRLFSYLFFGAILYFGFHYFVNVESRVLKSVATFFFGGLFLFFGLSQLNIISSSKYFFKVYKLQFRILENARKTAQKFPFLLGLLTGLFPCGWLYSFLLLSSQMKSLSQALILIFVFWLTSLPAFLIVTTFMQKLIRSSPSSHQKISGVILILAGLLSLMGHWVPVP